MDPGRTPPWVFSAHPMFAILHALGMFVADLFKSRSRLEAENLFLRHQLAIARFSGSESSIHTRFLAAFITITRGFEFSVHTGAASISLKKARVRCRNGMARIVESTTEARQGVTGNNVRYVLVWGIGGVIVAFVIVYFLFFL